MAEVSNIALYTTCTWAFLCDRKMLVIEHYVARAAVEY